MKKYILSIAILSLAIISCKKNPSVQPQYKDIVDAVFASGKAVTVNQYKVTAFSEGYLTASLVAEGDSVKIGQRLFTIQNDVQQTQVANALDNLKYAQKKMDDDAPQIQSLEEQINQANIKKQTDSINQNRYQNLLKTNAVAKADYDNVALTYKNDLSSIKVLEKSLTDLKQNLALNTINAKAQYQIQQQNNGFYTVTSAANGLILNVYKKNGDYIKKGETIADMGNGKVIARLQVAEDDINRIQLNQLVLISLNTDKDHVYKAMVSKIYPSFDETSQSFMVEATFTEYPNILKDGTQLQANFIIQEKKNVLVIPATYLSDGDSVTLKEGHKKLAIKTGIKTLEWIEVTDGLTGNEIIELPKK
jgi:multidrug efflux pump subunit AcrA (membrane-fusion protein)